MNLQTARRIIGRDDRVPLAILQQQRGFRQNDAALDKMWGVNVKAPLSMFCFRLTLGFNRDQGCTRSLKMFLLKRQLLSHFRLRQRLPVVMWRCAISHRCVRRSAQAEVRITTTRDARAVWRTCYASAAIGRL